jgi:uncharacterized membrane protein
VGLFSFWRKKPASHFSDEDQKAIVAEIKKVETRTSGEVRVFIENRCRFVDPLDRAAEIFFSLKMELTHHRNAVLVYVAMKDKQFAIFADEGIYQALGAKYWNEEARKMLMAFKSESYTNGLVNVLEDIGDAPHHHFPYEIKGDKNELPDDIVFGK